MRRLVFAMLLLVPLAACGQSEPQAEAAPEAEIAIERPWTRATAGDAATAAVFMTIASPAADRLVGASTPVAGKTDLMTMQGGSDGMEMAYLEAIAIPAGAPVTLNSAGLHVWLADLQQPLAAGESFPLTLEFEHAGAREVTVEVIAPAAPAPGS